MKQKNGMPLAQEAAEDIIEMIRTNHMKPGDGQRSGKKPRNKKYTDDKKRSRNLYFAK